MITRRIRPLVRLGFLVLLLVAARASFSGASSTPGEVPVDFKFVVVGDTQSDTGSTAINDAVVVQLIQDMNAHQPDFALFCGDLVSGTGTVNGTVAQWQEWIAKTAAFTSTRYVVPGNHDMYGGAGSFSAWQSTFPWLPTVNSPVGEEGLTYYFDVGNARFISILTDHETLGAVPPTQQVWLDDVLANSADKEHVFVFSHHPLSFSQAEVLGTTSGTFWQSLVSNEVDAFFAGHWHRYQPSRLGNGGDTWEVIIGTGGGWRGFDPIRPYQQINGFLLVEVTGPEAVATFYGDGDGDGAYDDPLDRFTLASATAEPAGIVAQYDFEDGAAGDTAPAPLGRGIDGVLIGGAHVVSGTPTGNALSLNGTNAYVEAGSLADYVLSLNGDMSFALRAEFDSLDTGTWSNTLLTYATNDYYGEDEETNYSYWLSVQDDGTLVSFWEHDNGVNVTLSSTVPAPVVQDQWHHYAVVRDSAARTVSFYVDGAPVGSPVAYPRDPTGGGRGMLYLGSDTVGATPFDGTLDEVRIYSRALSASEVMALAASPQLTVSSLEAGGTAILAASQGTAGTLTIFAYSTTGGGPIATGLGEVLLSPPLFVLAAVPTDPTGFASTTATVPLAAAGLPAWFQAVDWGARTLTNGIADVVR